MKCDRKWMPLYAVTDRAWLNGGTLAGQVERALRGGATCVQLREKHLSEEALAREAVELRALCARFGAPLIVNDSVEAALASGADGVHVGQDDADAAEVRRRIGPDKLLGVSAHSVEEALRAERDGADYLGVGAVFPTGTKTDAGALPLAALRDICAAVDIPVVAIGGVNAANLGALAGSGVAGVAVVSALFAAADVERAASELRAAVRRELGV